MILQALRVRLFTLNISTSLKAFFCCSFSAPYVKVYVMEGKRCLMKKKTRTARRTLEPLYQQQLEFKVEFTGKTLQVNELSFCSLTLIISPTGSLQFNSENGYMPCRSLGVRLNSFLRSFV